MTEVVGFCNARRRNGAGMRLRFCGEQTLDRRQVSVYDLFDDANF
jgi:hypothetical protein